MFNRKNESVKSSFSFCGIKTKRIFLKLGTFRRLKRLIYLYRFSLSKRWVRKFFLRRLFFYKLYSGFKKKRLYFSTGLFFFLFSICFRTYFIKCRLHFEELFSVFFFLKRFRFFFNFISLRRLKFWRLAQPVFTVVKNPKNEFALNAISQGLKFLLSSERPLDFFSVCHSIFDSISLPSNLGRVISSLWLGSGDSFRVDSRVSFFRDEKINYKTFFFFKLFLVQVVDIFAPAEFFDSLYKFYSFFSNFFFWTAEVFYNSFLIFKFLKKFTKSSNFSSSSFIVFSNLKSLKFFFNLRPFSIVVASFHALKSVLSSLPKVLAGRRLLVPYASSLGRQYKNSVKLFLFSLRRKQDFSRLTKKGTLSFKYKRAFKFISVLVKIQSFFIRRFFVRKSLRRYDPSRVYLFNFLKKLHYIYILNRTNIQYVWK